MEKPRLRNSTIKPPSTLKTH